MLCKIQSDTLTAIANEARRLTGTSAPLSPAQMATALSGVSVNAGGGEPCDSFKFCDFDEHPTDYGDNGTDGNGNALTPYTVLDYLPTYSISPPSTSITKTWINNGSHMPILDKFANLISGRTISNNMDILAEISMPSCTAIPAEAFAYSLNLAVAHFPACVSVGERAFQDCESFEEITLNSACAISHYAFREILVPSVKTLRLYLRGNAMGTCADNAFSVIDKEDCSYNSNFDPYETDAIPGLEIYVPASLLNDFKTTWAGGVFANNIYALTD